VVGGWGFWGGLRGGGNLLFWGSKDVCSGGVNLGLLGGKTKILTADNAGSLGFSNKFLGDPVGWGGGLKNNGLIFWGETGASGGVVLKTWFVWKGGFFYQEGGGKPG